ncbi:MAG: RHS repeat-associated core domain-containing protein [Gammaproteobacteria bacterium]
MPELQSVTVNLRFPGQYFDAETGLHYNYFRDYDPSLGRYVQSDRIGLAGGLNTYAYTANNPITYADPRGLIDPFDEPPSRGIGELLDRLFNEGADGDGAPSAKPGNESRPRDAPPGTKPIDKVGLSSDDIHDVERGIGAAPKDWVGIAPNGDVITSDPAGNAINHGPVDDYTRRPTGLCP